MNRFFLKSPGTGLMAIVMVFLLFGYANRGLVDLHTFCGTFQQGGKICLLYETMPIFEAGERAVFGTMSVDGKSWSEGQYLFSNSCETAPLGDDLYVFFPRSYSIFNTEKLFDGSRKARKKARVYPHEYGDLEPLWAGELDNAVMLLAVLESGCGNDDTSYMLTAFRVTPEGMNVWPGAGILKKDKPFGWNRDNGSFRAAVIGREVVACWVEESASDKGKVQLYWTLFKADDGFHGPFETSFNNRRFAVGLVGGKLHVVGVVREGEGRGVHIGLHGLDIENGTTISRYIDPDLMGLISQKRVFDLAIGAHGEKALLFAFVRNAVYVTEIQPHRQGPFTRVVGSTRLREILVNVWLYGIVLLSASAIFFALLSIITIRRRPRPEPTVTDQFPVPDLLHRGMAFMMDLTICMLPIFVLMWILGYLKEEGPQVVRLNDLQMWWILFSVTLMLYSVVFEVVAGRTPGKYMMRLKTVRDGGGRLSVMGACVRNSFKLLPWLMVVEVMFLIIFVRKQRLGDIIAGSIVTVDVEEE